MFGPVLADRSELQELADASQEAFDVILGGLRAAGVEGSTAAETDSDDQPPALPREIGLAAWAMAHGVAMLVIDGQFEATTEEEIERIARAATDLLWQGLSALPGSSEAGTRV